MELISERLVYNKITNAEFPDYRSWYTNDEVMKYITGKGLTEQEAGARFKKALETNGKTPEMGFYAVYKKKEGVFTGIAKIVYFKDDQAEVGYGSLPEFWGKGYASEMLLCLVNYSRSLPRIKELIAIVNPENAASKKVLTNQRFVWHETNLEDGRPVEYYRLIL